MHVCSSADISDNALLSQKDTVLIGVFVPFSMLLIVVGVILLGACCLKKRGSERVQQAMPDNGDTGVQLKKTSIVEPLLDPEGEKCEFSCFAYHNN